MPARPRIARPTADRGADRAKVVGLLADIRAARTDLRQALRDLPAPAQRTPAQRRDALVMRSVALLIQWVIIGSGAATTADRDNTET